MKIFQIIDSRNFGGIETHILQLCLFLKEQDIECSVVFVSEYKHNALREVLKEHKINFTEGNVLSIIKNNRDSVFHSHGYKANILNKTAKFMFGQKTICSYHSGEKPKGKVMLYEFLDKKSAFVSNRNIAISTLIKKQLFTNNSEIVYNFVYKDPEYRTSNSIENISFIGRLSEEKNPNDFFEISKLQKNLKFNIFGSGELSYLVPNENNIFFYGYVSDQNKIWRKTDLLLITSKHEGLPYVLIEAMSRGLIVISYKVGEIPNIIENGKNGFLVNNIEEMNNIVNKLQKLPEEEKEAIRIASLNTFNNLFGKDSANKFLSYYN